MARRRRRRHVSYPEAFAAATIIIAKRELQRRTGMALWGPLANRLLARRIGTQAATQIAQRASRSLPAATRLLAQRLGYRSAGEMSARLGSHLLRRAQGKNKPPQQ